MLVGFLAFALYCAAAILILMTLPLAVQAAAVLVLRDRPFFAPSKRPSLAVLVPAHNEEQGIGPTVLAIKGDLSPADRLVVIADNCTDQTAVLAAEAGAEVVVRTNQCQRGKGFALAAGLHHISSRNPEVVVFVDADCRFGPEGIEQLARACVTVHAPVQCLYSMTADGNRPASARLAEFAWRIKNDLRPTGYARLGLPCQLLGSGIAIPWPLIDVEMFSTGHVTEDVLLGLELAMRGHPPRFFRGSRVASLFPTTGAARQQQKQRWIHGQLGLVKSHWPRLLQEGLRRRDLNLLALAADLAVPPLGLLAIANIALALLSAGYLIAGGTAALLYLPAFAGGLTLFSFLTAWYVHGRDLIGVRELAQLPRHFIAVARSAIDLARGRKSGWVRTDRA